MMKSNEKHIHAYTVFTERAEGGKATAGNIKKKTKKEKRNRKKDNEACRHQNRQTCKPRRARDGKREHLW